MGMMLACRVWATCWLLANGPVVDQSAAPVSAHDAVNISRWVRELDHDDFAVRDAATLSLAQTGVPALPALQQAVHAGSPEVRIRAAQVLAAWYERADDTAVDDVEDVLETLLDISGTVGDQAEIAWDRQKRNRETRCLAHLEQLGARVRYREDRFGVDREDLAADRKVLLHIAITPQWQGGDDGLKYLRRIPPRDALGFTVYRVNGNRVSDAAFQELEDAGIRVEKRGAKLGVSNGSAFDPAPLNIPGFRVGQIEPRSAAEKAGIQIDDIITGFSDKPITDFNDLVGYLLASKPGDQAEFTVLRENRGKREPHKIAVELGDW